MMLTDKVIIVTGASSGIGKSIAVELSKSGAKCVLIGRNVERLEHVNALCVNETMIIAEELSNFDKYEDIVQKVYDSWGKIYGFVHSAGVEQTVLIPQIKVNDLKNIFDVNVFSAIEFVKHLSKKKYKDDEQSFVMISSVMGVVGNKGLTAYSATKGAIISMVRSMALELAVKKIRINAVSPGHISDSEMSLNKESKLSEESNKAIADNHPLGLGTCSDVANIVRFLLTDQSRWITGQNIVTDGGYSIQ